MFGFFLSLFFTFFLARKPLSNLNHVFLQTMLALLKSTLVLSLTTITGIKATPIIQDKIRGAYFGAVVADALALSTHYEYDAKKIRKFYGNIDQFYAPGEKTGGATHGVGWGKRNYHGGNGVGPAKKAGENTDYGDYNFLILNYLASNHANEINKPISLKQLVPMWQTALKTWRSWICTQTKATLRQVQQNTPYTQLGGRSNAMAIR